MGGFILSDSLGYYLSKSYNLFKSHFNKILIQNRYNLNSDHWTILIILNNNPGINQSVISKILQRDKPAVTRLIDFMEKEKYVERRNDSIDRRAHNIFLTKTGENLYKKILALVEVESNKLIEGINQKNMQIMKDTLAILIERMVHNKYNNKHEKLSPFLQRH